MLFGMLVCEQYEMRMCPVLGYVLRGLEAFLTWRRNQGSMERVPGILVKDYALGLLGR